MKHQDVFFHGWSHFFQGHRITLGALAVCALLLSPLANRSQAAVTELGFVKALASYAGATGDIGGSDSDFIAWGKNLGLSINDPDAPVDQLKLMLYTAQLKDLNLKKYGGNLERILQREDIDIDGGLEDHEDTMEYFDRFGPQFDLRSPVSPVRGGRPGGKIPPGFLNPRNPHFGTPIDELPGAQGIANAQNRGNRR